MTNFSIGDLLIRIKNASLVARETIEVPKFKFGLGVLEILKDKGFIGDYEITGNTVLVTLKYEDNGMPSFQDVKLFSRPGRRWYIKSLEMTPVRSGTGIQIVSTPKGVMTTVDAKKANVGGELICEVW
ncbi:MAG: 30S ribosomal protein S8 [Candidatus Dojkabacteria bacterium]|nr:MAG: 30S ribosomal protein S8 [Candidatus Dojkabacteria bacterium]